MTKIDERIERHNLNLRTHIKRLARKTICSGEELRLDLPKERPPFWQAFRFDLLRSGLKSCDDST